MAAFVSDDRLFFLESPPMGFPKKKKLRSRSALLHCFFFTVNQPLLDHHIGRTIMQKINEISPRDPFHNGGPTNYTKMSFGEFSVIEIIENMNTKSCESK